MIFLLSPSKTQDFEDELSYDESTKPVLFKQSLQIVDILKKQSSTNLAKTLSVSKKLAELNYERYQAFSKSLTKSNSRQALLSFRGDVYQGFHLEQYKKRDFEYAQKHLRILSGLYGILRPLDRIQPYRLEMKTKLKVASSKNLYEFWTEAATSCLNKDIRESKSKVLINLASQEYSKALNKDALTAPVIDIVFKEKKGKALKTVALFAKQARGEMANWAIVNKAKDPKQLIDFNVNGYSYVPSLSAEDEYVFVR